MAKMPMQQGVVKSSPISGTTSGTSGSLSLGTWDGKTFPVLAQIDGGHRGTFFISNTGSLYLQVFTISGGDIAPLLNTAITGTYYYIND